MSSRFQPSDWRGHSLASGLVSADGVGVFADQLGRRGDVAVEAWAVHVPHDADDAPHSVAASAVSPAVAAVNCDRGVIRKQPAETRILAVEQTQ